MLQKLKNIYHLLEAVLANLRYSFPSREVTVIGVTGTDGKTTTTSLIYHILKHSGKKVAMITSVGAYIGDQLYDIGFHVTTPSSFAVQKYLRKAVSAGNEFVILETTSHALDQYRVWGVDYNVGVLTNITHEHLDYHHTYQEYVAAKTRLLKIAPQCVINYDDESYALVLPHLKNRHVMTYSLTNSAATITPKKFPFQSPLIGNFNKRNSLAAIVATQIVGVADEEIRAALKTFVPPPGRQEIVYSKDFMVMIDFAHTPNAFEELLPELAKRKKHALIHVFGSAGLRDATKRPLMGRASSTHADVIVLTVEDPRTEKVADINAAIVSGMKGFDKKSLFLIDDRKAAITFAISQAKKGDIVVITGKSHEKSMNYDGVHEEPWDEFAAVQDALLKR